LKRTPLPSAEEVRTVKQTVSPQRFFERAPVALAHVDRRGAITLANDAFARLAGRKASALRGEPLDALLEWPGLGSDPPGALAAAAAAGRATAATLRRGKATERAVAVCAEGDGAGGFVIAVSVGGEERGAHRAPPEVHPGSHDDLAGLIASGLAHHLNNHLTTVVTNAALLAPRIAELPPDNGDFLAEITEASSHAAAMIRRLLAFSRKARIPLQPLALGLHLKELAARLERDLPAGITVECVDRLGGAVPADAASIDRIVGHLVVNAREAMPDGGTFTITSSATHLDGTEVRPWRDLAPGEYVGLTVTDTGIGMAPEVRARAFEPFFTTKPLGTGTGLGLATVYGIVRQFGGAVRLTSDVGAGTTVEIMLPATADARGENGDDTGGTRRRGPATVLVVEDQADVRRLLVRILETGGYRVVTAGDGAEALETARGLAAPPDVVLTDVVTPGMSGSALVTELREFWRDETELRVLYMSGYTDGALADQGMLADGAQLIQKPFAREDLLARLAVLAGRHR
jgi:signal transduction histidine kinase/CheY-like chemotaxis protein